MTPMATLYPPQEASQKSTPLRYRGYVYDTETGFYYLQSRYYDPSIGRFLNADGFASTGQGILGNNMFAYCGNSPIINKDSDGKWWEVVIPVLAGGVVGAVTEIIEGGSPSDVLDGALKGMATSAIDAFVPGSGTWLSLVSVVDEFVGCVFDGSSTGKTVRDVALAYLSEQSFFPTGDSLADVIVDATFGTGMRIICAVIVVATEPKDAPQLSKQSAQSALYSVIATGAGGMGMFHDCFGFDGKENLGYRL